LADHSRNHVSDHPQRTAENRRDAATPLIAVLKHWLLTFPVCGAIGWLVAQALARFS
jgi:hypothetical protein